MIKRTPTRPTRRNAFTITELLVVIAIIVLLIAIAVPALSGLMGSSERSLAENQLRAALSAAIQSETGDGAAVFLFTLNSNGNGGHITVVPCIAAGQLEDIDDNALAPSNTNLLRTRDVFVPIPNIEPVQI